VTSTPGPEPVQDTGGIPGRPRRPPASPLVGTPDAERYVLEADVMRRRQLRSALLHGSSRTWREHRRTWPAVVVGVLLIAVALAAMAVVNAYQRQQQINKEREQDLGGSVVLRYEASASVR